MTNVLKHFVIFLVYFAYTKAASNRGSSSVTTIQDPKAAVSKNFTSIQKFKMNEKNRIISIAKEAAKSQVLDVYDKAFSCQVDHFRSEISGACEPCSDVCNESVTDRECQYYCPWEYAKRDMVPKSEFLDLKSNVFILNILIGTLGVVVLGLVALCIWKLVFRRKRKGSFKSSKSSSLPLYTSKEDISLMDSRSSDQSINSGNGARNNCQVNKAQTKYPEQEQGRGEPFQDTTYNEEGAQIKPFPPKNVPPTDEYTAADETTSKSMA